MIYLRPANIRDIKKVFDLANDPEVRKHSIHSAPILWKRHQEWFVERIQKTDNPFYIVENENGDFIGQVRFDRYGKETIISISLSVAWRGRGLSVSIIQASIEKSGLESVCAYIKEENKASRKAFLKAGFQQAGLKNEQLLKFSFYIQRNQ